MNDDFFTEDSKREGVITSIIKRLAEAERFIVGHLSVPHYPYPVAARVYNNANISVASGGAGQALTFNTVRRDNGGLFGLANPSRLTAPVDGWYLITGTAQWAASAAGRRIGTLKINGTAVAVTEWALSATATTPRINPTTFYYMTAGQYAEFWVYQDTGGALNIEVAANYSPEFAMALIK
jgi:hypothetical protein